MQPERGQRQREQDANGVDTMRTRPVGFHEGLPMYEDEALVTSHFSNQFLRDHGLPDYVYIAKGYYFLRKDMRTMLFDLLTGHPSQGFEIESIRSAMIDQEKQRAATAGERPNIEQISAKANESYNYFLWGIYPLIRLENADTQRTLRAGVGGEGTGAILNEIQPNMKWIAQELRKDSQAVSAMRVWTALGGSKEENYRNIAGMTDEENAIVERHFETFKKMMEVKEFKILKGQGGEESDQLMTRQLAVEEMNKVAKELEDLGLDKGVIILTRKITGLLAWNPETVDARKQFANYEKYLQGDIKASRTLIGRTMYNDPNAPTFADSLKNKGMEGMLEQIRDWTHARFWLQLSYGGTVDLLKKLNFIDDCVRGRDEFANVSERRKAVIKAVDELMAHKEFPPLENKTAQRLVQMPLMGGKGTLKASEWQWGQTIGEGIKDSFIGDILGAFKKKE